MLYILLALLGLLPTVWLVLRRKEAALIATYFLAVAIVHTADWLAGSFGLYKYHPALFRDQSAEGAAGVILAEFLFVGSLAVWLVAYVSVWGPLLGAGLVGALEFLFESIGALEYNGWQLWYSNIGFTVYFWLIYRFWRALHKQGTTDEWPCAAIRMALAAVFHGMFSVLQWVTQAVHMPLHLRSVYEQDQSLARFFWHVGIGVPLGYWILAGDRKHRPLRLLASTVVSLALNYVLASAGLRIWRPPWSPMVHGMLQSVFFALACLVDDWIRAWSTRTDSERVST